MACKHAAIPGAHLVMDGVEDVVGVHIEALGRKFGGVAAHVGRQLLPAVARPDVPHRAGAPIAAPAPPHPDMSDPPQPITDATELFKHIQEKVTDRGRGVPAHCICRCSVLCIPDSFCSTTACSTIFGNLPLRQKQHAEDCTDSRHRAASRELFCGGTWGLCEYSKACRRSG